METASTSTRVDISRALQIEGWTSEEELRWLAEQAQALPHESKIVEIGTFKGRSARALLDNIDESCSLFCVDPYEDYPDKEVREKVSTWDSTIEEAAVNLMDRDYLLTCLYEPSRRASIRFHDHTIDMIFIDGDHSYSSVLADITAWERTVKPGGLICGHDYNVHPGVKQAVDECFPFGRIKFPAGSIWAVRKPH